MTLFSMIQIIFMLFVTLGLGHLIYKVGQFTQSHKDLGKAFEDHKEADVHFQDKIERKLESIVNRI